MGVADGVNVSVAVGSGVAVGVSVYRGVSVAEGVSVDVGVSVYGIGRVGEEVIVSVIVEVGGTVGGGSVGVSEGIINNVGSVVWKASNGFADANSSKTAPATTAVSTNITIVTML